MAESVDPPDHLEGTETAMAESVDPPDHLEGTETTDGHVAKALVAVANRSSRRGFLALVGRASVAVLGGSLIGVWHVESARAACTWEGPFGETPRSSCLCTELIGQNNCPNCCSGFWESCKLCSHEDNCCVGSQRKIVRLYDCCGPCSGGCVHPGACGTTMNASCCFDGYCNFPGAGCSGKKVRCVRKVCTNINCP